LWEDDGTQQRNLISQTGSNPKVRGTRKQGRLAFIGCLSLKLYFAERAYLPGIA
jgi:hypothetical protein